MDLQAIGLLRNLVARMRCAKLRVFINLPNPSRNLFQQLFCMYGRLSHCSLRAEFVARLREEGPRSARPLLTMRSTVPVL